MFLPQNTGIVVDIILEDWLTLFQIDSHESICILHRHLRIESMHGPILN